jgi:hypothetical protein
MRHFALFLTAILIFALTATPSEAKGKHHRRHGKKAACCASKGAGEVKADTGFRAAEWGKSVYHTSESCPAVAQIPKDRLVSGLPATYGRKAARCCCSCKS